MRPEENHPTVALPYHEGDLAFLARDRSDEGQEINSSYLEHEEQR